jgi:iron complex outermembrane receptor protein
MSAGIEDTINFTKKLYAIAGVSYDRAKGLRATEWDPSSVAGGWYTFPTDTVSTWNPQFGLFYLLSDTGKLHASVAKKTAFPSMKDKFQAGWEPNLQILVGSGKINKLRDRIRRRFYKKDTC